MSVNFMSGIFSQPISWMYVSAAGSRGGSVETSETAPDSVEVVSAAMDPDSRRTSTVGRPAACDDYRPSVISTTPPTMNDHSPTDLLHSIQVPPPTCRTSTNSKPIRR